MFNLYLQGGQLDVLDGQSVEKNYTPVRFMDDLTDQYTTDFELPNNMHNVKLLQASGLLDSERRFSSRLEPATLSLNGEIYPVYVQVASIDSSKITVCIFEKYIPSDVLNKKMLDFVKDDSHSIYRWKKYSWEQYPDVYKKYNNGMYGKFDNANWHQSRQLNNVLTSISLSSGYQLPFTDDKLWVTATEKNVCPQNTRQILEVNFTDGEYGQISGGQHITNDASWKWTGGDDTITFNRRCNVTMNIYISYSRSTLSTSGYDHFVLIDLDSHRSQTPHQSKAIVLQTRQHYNDIVTDTWTVANNYIDADTTMQFQLQGADTFRFCSCVIDITVTDYEIIEDDYGIDMTYVARDPRMKFRNYSDSTERYIYFDGTTQEYKPYYGGAPHYLFAPDVSFAYLGFWCNLQRDTTLKDLLYGLQWLTQKRFTKDKWEYVWVDIDTKYNIDGVINKFDTTNDKLGVNNHLLFAGEDDNDENIVSNIDSAWLESNVTIHQSPFTYSLKRNGTWAYFQQYTEPKDDEDTGEHSAKFDSVDGLALSKIEPETPNLLRRLTLPTLGFDEITEATTVEIETLDNVKNADYVYLHGRKFMVQSIATDLRTGKSTVTAIEVWKQNPPSEIKWPPKVEITSLYNIGNTSVEVAYTIDNN